MKILFAGTPEFASTVLAHLIQAQLKPMAVWTQPDKPQGRGKRLESCPTKKLAMLHGIKCFSPKSLKSIEAQQEIAAFTPDLLIVAAYGLILPQAVLDIPRFGCINVHASLLPKWRGAAPIARAIWEGDSKTGVTLMQMDAGLDTGDMISIKEIKIEDNDDGLSLHNKLAQLGGEMMVELLMNWPSDNQLSLTPQPDGATYAHKLSKNDGHIDWKQPGTHIERQVRALKPWPGTFSFCNQERIKIISAQYSSKTSEARPGTIVSCDENLSVATQDGVLQITELQLPGKKAMNWSDMRNGQTLLQQGVLLT